MSFRRHTTLREWAGGRIKQVYFLDSKVVKLRIKRIGMIGFNKGPLGVKDYAQNCNQVHTLS